MIIAPIKQVITNGNRYANERNDCTVRALSIACEIPYANAHAELFLAGREHGKGFHFAPFARSKEWKEYPRPAMEVDSYVQYIAHSGNWIVQVRGHVFAVINGIIHDSLRLEGLVNRHVVRAWKIK